MRKLRIPGLILVLFFVFRSNMMAQDFSCTDCHENVKIGNAHSGAVECADCHDSVTEDTHPGDTSPVKCANCHDDKSDLQNANIHYRLGDKVKNPPDCKSCHKTHEINKLSSIRNKQDYFCSGCHENIQMANLYHSVVEKDETCAECHDVEEPAKLLAESKHKMLRCADCHNYISHNLESHQENVPSLQPADCYLCHNDIAAEHRESIHGISLQAGVNEAAQCWDCHGGHNIKGNGDPLNKVSDKNIAGTCAGCHENPELVEKYNWSVINPSKMYNTSVHGKLVAEGKEAATCADCHGVHNIKNRVQAGSQISSSNIPATCEKCHSEITAEYNQSIHWIMAKKGIRSAPVCTDCHSEHSVNMINSGNKRHEMRLIQEETCYGCHNDPVIARRYNSSDNQTLSYQDSYHGLAVMGGDENAAMCIDCHGAHKILPGSHPESLVNEANITETCGKCHEGATPIFANSYSHKVEESVATSIEYWVEKLYIILIIVVIGGMLAHNALVFIKEIKAKRKSQANKIKITRLNRNELIQHIILLTSFIILVITGFALKFPNSFWAESLRFLGLDEFTRSIIHRVAAVTQVALSFYHLWYLLFTKRGRKMLLALWPKLSDVPQTINSLLYYLGLSKNPPKFDNFSYIEKAEYWALIWGVIVMTCTGLVLWFPTFVGDWAPTWFIKVSELIHFYEAILASLAIVVWHWFFVIFRPSEYPMSFAWIDGKITIDEFKHHHTLRFEKIVEELEYYQAGKITKDELGYFTEQFLTNLEEAKITVVEFLEEAKKKH